MKVALMFDGISALGAAADQNIVETVETVERILRDDGHEVVRFPVTMDGRWIERMRRGRFDLAFNLCEGIDGVAAYEPPVISVLELLGLAYTGSSSWTTSVCLRKHLVNGLLAAGGLPVPRWGLVRRGEPLPTIGFPAICKPAAEDASIGIEQRSVVRSVKALAERVDVMHERWDELIVQRYIEGREVNVGIVGSTVLPVAEIRFDALPKGMWRIVSYRSKWEVGSEEDLGALPQCPAELEEPLQAEVERIALAAWRAVGGEGYGRVDLRIDRAGRPWILEVNANPDLAPDAGLARMSRVAGCDYAELVRQICRLAAERSESMVPVAARWALAQQLSGIEHLTGTGGH